MIDATRRMRLAAVGALAAVLLVSGCAPEETSPSPSPTPSRTPSASPTATAEETPEETPDSEPSPEPTVFPSPQTPSEGTASDGWTHAQLIAICEEWVVDRPDQNADERWNFDGGLPAQRFGAVWDVGFDGTITVDGIADPVAAYVACAVTGTPEDYSVALSEGFGDTPADEVLRP